MISTELYDAAKADMPPETEVDRWLADNLKRQYCPQLAEPLTKLMVDCRLLENGRKTNLVSGTIRDFAVSFALRRRNNAEYITRFQKEIMTTSSTCSRKFLRERTRMLGVIDAAISRHRAFLQQFLAYKTKRATDPLMRSAPDWTKELRLGSTNLSLTRLRALRKAILSNKVEYGGLSDMITEATPDLLWPAHKRTKKDRRPWQPIARRFVRAAAALWRDFGLQPAWAVESVFVRMVNWALQHILAQSDISVPSLEALSRQIRDWRATKFRC